MGKLAPKIDRRTAKEIAEQVQDLLEKYTEDSKPLQGTRAALVNIFARFAEIIIERLNQVPEKNFLAFLDLLGASRLPPQPARVPLTFSLAAGTTVNAVVPKGTQVAAPPAAGEKEPVIFETERELVVTAAKLESIFVRDPEQDRWSDRSLIINQANSSGVAAFRGSERIEHILYIRQDSLFNNSALEEVRLNFQIAELEGDIPDRIVQWEIWDSNTEISFSPQPEQENSENNQTSPLILDETANLTNSGNITFSRLRSSLAEPQHLLNNRWLRCRFLTPITSAIEQHLPQVTNLTIQGKFNSQALKVQNALSNQVSLDLSQPFFPFGEKPRFGDTLYLNLAEHTTFSKDGTIELQVNVIDPTDAGIERTEEPINPNLRLQWRFWDGEEWTLLGTSTRNEDYLTTDELQQNTSNNFQDNTEAFTNPGTQVVSFTLPGQPKIKNIGGIDSAWIQVQITAGDYGKEASYIPDRNEDGTVRRDAETGDIKYIFRPASFAPPLIGSITADYSLDYSPTPAIPSQQVLLSNDFVNEQIDLTLNQSFVPFKPTQEAKPTPKPALYLGLVPPANGNFSNRPLSLFFRIVDIVYGEELDNPTPKSSPQLSWQYWNGKEWTKLLIRDETENFTRSGLIEFLPPADFAPREDFNRPPRYWLRVQWLRGEYEVEPRLEQVLLNTTMAVQTVTIQQENLGSSDGSENQQVQTTRQPILAGQQLEVREPEVPSALEKQKIVLEEGEDAITTIADATGRPQAIWVRWHQVKDFYESEARDRHYVLDNLTGKITFGDGRNGLIPPSGKGNIRMSRYQTGGGTAGNKPAGSIVQLKTTVPYVDKAINHQAAAGGAAAETLESLIERAPKEIRHRNRAVTVEDYQDLAKLASPAVSRAKCVPLANLKATPFVDTKLEKLPGAVSVIIVPRSTEAQPLPSLELINRVQDYLETYAQPTVQISVVGPLYVRVEITAEIALTSLEGASEVAQAVEQQLASFLHPLTGGFEGMGWDFGREPYKSDLYRLLEGISGVDHVRSLRVDEGVDRTNDQMDEMEQLTHTKQTGRFLVYSGNHDISLTFVE